MPRIAVFGGNGYLASLIKNQNYKKKNTYTFFSRKLNDKNYINFSSYKNTSPLPRPLEYICNKSKTCNA